MQTMTKVNERQIPKAFQICSNKLYNDLMYAYLQSISERDEQGIRYVNKGDIKFTKLGEILSMTRQTASSKFKNLLELGMIQELSDGRYEIIPLENELAMLLHYDTLKLMVDALNENSISVYAYLFNRYWANEQKPFQFTLEQIKKHIGISTKTRSNDDIITNILFVLKKIGLIDYEMTTAKQGETNFQNVKTIYAITWMTNRIQKKC